MLPALFVMLLYEHLYLLVEGRHLVDFHFMGDLSGPSGGDYKEVRLRKSFNKDLIGILSVDFRTGSKILVVALRALVGRNEILYC